jgi:membrane-associated phospholipid phosphatase
VFKQRFQQQVRQNQQLFALFAILWLIALIIQVIVPQFTISEAVNQVHSPALDATMVLLTTMAEGWWLVICGLILIVWKPNYWFVIILCLAVPSLFTQLLKHGVFIEANRPALALPLFGNLHQVAGVSINRYNSFPSGHTTAAFSLYTLCGLLLHHKKAGWIWPLIAACVGISRVYLLQHFWFDILIGSLIGCLLCTFIFAWLIKWVKHES